MNHGPEFTKWTELRAKTDRQLAAFLAKTLARGLRLAVEGAECDAPELYALAHQDYAQARRLLPLLRDVAVAERRCLERELARLGSLLDEAATLDAPVRAACS